MNTPNDLVVETPQPTAPAQSIAQIENCVRKHPGATVLLVAGLGIAAVLIARALTPPPPRNRALRMLEDIQHQLAALADDGVQAVSRGVNTLGGLHLDRSFDKIGRRFRTLFH